MSRVFVKNETRGDQLDPIAHRPVRIAGKCDAKRVPVRPVHVGWVRGVEAGYTAPGCKDCVAPGGNPTGRRTCMVPGWFALFPAILRSIFTLQIVD